MGRFVKEKITFLVILGSQGGPLERPWEGFSEENVETEKKVEKKRVKPIASEGDADPGKEGLGWMGQALFDTPSLILTDGRADCLRFAHPAEAT